MLGNLALWIVVAAWAVWIIFYWGKESFSFKDIRDTVVKAENSSLDRILVIVITVGGLVMMVTMALVVLNVVASSTGETVRLIGALLAVLGVAGSFYCRRYLGRFWTAVTAVKKDHLIIDKGPYGLVRHPIYSVTLVMYLGTVMVFSVWWLWLIFAILVAAYTLKALDEEQFLIRQLPDAYTNYRQRVRYRLIPGIW